MSYVEFVPPLRMDRNGWYRTEDDRFWAIPRFGRGEPVTFTVVDSRGSLLLREPDGARVGELDGVRFVQEAHLIVDEAQRWASRRQT